ncbi:MAG: LysM peptidoglycan-binding domain-containing protein [Gammaproteobacteria bacterium]|nr:MAG: LysM peptidoglycan-binding domain-containing protein [Gammaproteobacteria bacterium]
MSAKRLMGAMLGVTLLGALPLASLGDTLKLNPDHPNVYSVVKGDTLWDISKRFLNEPWRWPELWAANPQIANPHLIYPGDTLALEFVDGKPRLKLKRGRPQVKLSPTMRETVKKKAIATVPVDAIQQFLSRLKFLDKAEMDKAPYIISSPDEHLVTGKGDRIYVRGLNGSVDDRYQVYHLGDPLIDPESNKVLAYKGIFVGDARTQQRGETSTMLLTSSRREAATGDRLLPVPKGEYYSSYMPHAPAQNFKGKIISILDGLNQVGSFQTVIINRGKRDGLEKGHVLAVYTKGEAVLDPGTPDPADTAVMPDDRAGLIMVIESFEGLSYALVMHARRNMRLYDDVRTP